MAERPPYSWRGDPEVPPFPDDRPLIVFDGECVLCSATAVFVLRRDRKRRFNLTTAQGPLGSALYRHFGLRDDEEGTMIVLEEGRLLTRSAAALAIAGGLGWPWRAATLFRLTAPPFRDSLYQMVARNRFEWFGRRESCWVPSPDERDRVI